jgi:sporulation integral membrane protein YlbJ
MTAIYNTKKKKSLKTSFEVCLCLVIFILAIVYGGLLKEGVIYGFKICAFNIIPTLFPFFILSDLWGAVICYQENSLMAKCFEKIFHINSEGLSAFVIGNICGFPLGAKTAAKKHQRGDINTIELDSLMTISNNPSLAFIVSGIGVGLFHSIKIGIILYFSVLISAVISGLIFRPTVTKSSKPLNKTKQSFNLIDSINSAGFSSIAVSSYIIFFSGIIGVVKSLVKNEIIVSLISSFLEVGSGCSIIAESNEALGVFHLPLISFTLAFSGLSVFMQTFSFLPQSISKIKYLLKKFFQGIISALITFLLHYIM